MYDAQHQCIRKVWNTAKVLGANLTSPTQSNSRPQMISICIGDYPLALRRLISIPKLAKNAAPPSPTETSSAFATAP